MPRVGTGGGRSMRAGAGSLRDRDAERSRLATFGLRGIRCVVLTSLTAAKRGRPGQPRASCRRAPLAALERERRQDARQQDRRRARHRGHGRFSRFAHARPLGQCEDDSRRQSCWRPARSADCPGRARSFVDGPARRPAAPDGRAVPWRRERPGHTGARAVRARAGPQRRAARALRARRAARPRGRRRGAGGDHRRRSPRTTDPSALAFASRRAGEPWFCFEQPDRDGAALAALGCVRAIRSSGPRRFADAAAAWRELAAHAEAGVPDGPAGAGPRGRRRLRVRPRGRRRAPLAGLRAGRPRRARRWRVARRGGVGRAHAGRRRGARRRPRPGGRAASQARAAELRAGAAAAARPGPGRALPRRVDRAARALRGRPSRAPSSASAPATSRRSCSRARSPSTRRRRTTRPPSSACCAPPSAPASSSAPAAATRRSSPPRPSCWSAARASAPRPSRWPARPAAPPTRPSTTTSASSCCAPTRTARSSGSSPAGSPARCARTPSG